MRVSPTTLNSFLYCKEISDYTNIRNTVKKIKASVDPNLQALMNQGCNTEDEIYKYYTEKFKNNKDISNEISEISMSLIEDYLNYYVNKDSIFQKTYKYMYELDGEKIQFYCKLDIDNPNDIIDLKFTSKTKDKVNYDSSVQHTMYQIATGKTCFRYITYSAGSMCSLMTKYLNVNKEHLDNTIREFIEWLKTENLYNTYKNNFKTIY